MADDEPVEFRHRDELLALGATDRQIRVWQQKNRMTRVWRGAYHLGGRLPPWEELRLSAIAAAQRSSDATVLSHAAAAAVHGMATLNSDWKTVDFTCDGVRGGTKRGRRRLHVRRLDAEDVVVVDGVTVTSIARTALDLALAGDFVAAVCALDAALRMGVVRADLEAAIARLGRRQGIANLLAALEEASPLSESVGESRSRALMLKWPEIPRPELQRELFNEAGALEARVDFLWAERVVGEFDGKGKQEGGFTSEQRIQRDSLLMSRNLYPTHWDWDDCEEPDRLRNRLHDALGPFGLLLDGSCRYRS
ncbi:hypothetical protein [Tsukamurella spumae]|uniref:Transcriptional regulator, AbiEi antitoxin, Type IV TA system n=1 Tax=Tsukamurella spumae TaxID=44753 RepID=A0A846WWB4_9ACTN|nr:hypothetical protein [Tsukamurella spumae]NKY17211.1 hypothetical protein [Tsukamurella spumae]